MMIRRSDARSRASGAAATARTRTATATGRGPVLAVVDAATGPRPRTRPRAATRRTRPRAPPRRRKDGVPLSFMSMCALPAGVRMVDAIQISCTTKKYLPLREARRPLARASESPRATEYASTASRRRKARPIRLERGFRSRASRNFKDTPTRISAERGAASRRLAPPASTSSRLYATPSSLALVTRKACERLPLAAAPTAQ